MGREIRRVIPNWQHPTQKCDHSPWAGGCNQAKRNGGQCFHPLYDEDFETVAVEWLKALMAWEDGSDTDRATAEAEEGERKFYWEWDGGPPDREYYRPRWREEDATWFQIYETVSEGTPVTPPFATKKELVDYLVTNGDYWDQQRGEGGWTQENAAAFVEREWAPSMVAHVAPDHVETRTPRDGGF